MIASLFEGLYGYEALMLVCGFALFIVGVVAIVVLLTQKRDIKTGIYVVGAAVVLMGFPGIQAVKVGNGMVELDRIIQQPAVAQSADEKAQAQALLDNLRSRTADDPAVQAKVAAGYSAIGDTDTAYNIANRLLKTKASPAVQQVLAPVLVARLNQLQRASPAAPANNESVAAAPPAGNANLQATEQAAAQLQSMSAALPASSHIALARAFVRLGQKDHAKASVDAARKVDPAVDLSPVLRANTQP
jgi:hypothetical protein